MKDCAFLSPHLNVLNIVVWQPCSGALFVIHECTCDPPVAMVSVDSTTDALFQKEVCSKKGDRHFSLTLMKRDLDFKFM